VTTHENGNANGNGKSLFRAGGSSAGGRFALDADAVETLRAVETALPDRTSLSTGTLSGEMHGQPWSVDSAPFPGDFVNPRAAQFWTPQTIVVKVQSRINTANLAAADPVSVSSADIDSSLTG
jgi:hypothetical protein